MCPSCPRLLLPLMAEHLWPLCRPLLGTGLAWPLLCRVIWAMWIPLR